MCILLEVQNVDLYLIIQYFVFFINLMLSLLALYVIVYHSPTQLTTYKYFLIVHIVCFFLQDFVFSICMSLVIYPDIWGLRQTGLTSMLGFSVKSVFCLGTLLAFEVVGIYTHMLIFRTRAIISTSHIFYFNKYIHNITVLLSHSIWIVATSYSYYVFSVDFRDKYVQLQISNVCTHSYGEIVLSNDVMVVPDYLKDFTILHYCVNLSVIAVVWSSMVLACIHTLHSSGSTLSSRTKKLQKSLLRTLFLQCTIPLVLMAVPVLTVMVINSPAYGFIAMLIFSCHGIANIIVLLLGHRDYRKTVFNWIRRIYEKSSNSPTHVGVSPVHTVGHDNITYH